MDGIGNWFRTISIPGAGPPANRPEGDAVSWADVGCSCGMEGVSLADVCQMLHCFFLCLQISPRGLEMTHCSSLFLYLEETGLADGSMAKMLAVSMRIQFGSPEPMEMLNDCGGLPIIPPQKAKAQDP